VAFERIAKKIYSMLPKKKSEMNQFEQMGVVFTSGYIAGILCGAVSHPADTLISKINQLKMEGSFVKKASHIYGEIGFAGLWKGFAPRVVMVKKKKKFHHFS
jgi:solute carrier family 25 (mitochondrial phosphate transporter), member 3